MGTRKYNQNMAVFEIIEGQPGNGKSLYTARVARKLVDRNRRWFEKSGSIRLIYSNLKFSHEFEDYATITIREEIDGKWVSQKICLIRYWNNVDEVSKLRDCDLIWDEIATEMDSRTFTSLSDEVKRFLSQYDKRGIEIYANTQDYSLVDLRARMFVTRVATMTKIIGSPRPSPTKPPLKRIWGLILVRDVAEWKATDPSKKQYDMIPGFFFINENDVKIYDTRQAIEATTLPIKKLRKQIAVCDEDGYKKTTYV